MRPRMKLVLAALSATILLGIAVNSASATHLSVSEQRFRISWAALTFGGSAFAAPVECPVTLEGTFHSATIAKVNGALIGYITRASVISERCTGGHATILQETLPWHVQFGGFTGTLPRILTVRLNLVGAAFLVEVGFGSSCLFVTSSTNPGVGTASLSAGRITGLAASGTIPLNRGTFGCPSPGTFTGTGTVTNASGGSVTVTLI